MRHLRRYCLFRADRPSVHQSQGLIYLADQRRSPSLLAGPLHCDIGFNHLLSTSLHMSTSRSSGRAVGIHATLSYRVPWMAHTPRRTWLTLQVDATNKLTLSLSLSYFPYPENSADFSASFLAENMTQARPLIVRRHRQRSTSNCVVMSTSYVHMSLASHSTARCDAYETTISVPPSPTRAETNDLLCIHVVRLCRSLLLRLARSLRSLNL